jgi:hypothetical protein
MAAEWPVLSPGLHHHYKLHLTDSRSRDHSTGCCQVGPQGPQEGQDTHLDRKCLLASCPHPPASSVTLLT